MPVEDLLMSQLQGEEEFTDQRCSHFKLYSRKFQITATILQLKVWQNCLTSPGFGKHC